MFDAANLAWDLRETHYTSLSRNLVSSTAEERQQKVCIIGGVYLISLCTEEVFDMEANGFRKDERELQYLLTSVGSLSLVILLFDLRLSRVDIRSFCVCGDTKATFAAHTFD